MIIIIKQKNEYESNDKVEIIKRLTFFSLLQTTKQQLLSYSSQVSNSNWEHKLCDEGLFNWIFVTVIARWNMTSIYKLKQA